MLPLSPTDNYDNLRFDMIRRLEGRELLPYWDNADDPNPTIGYGFNLRDGDVRNDVFIALGLNVDSFQCRNGVGPR